MFFDPFKNPFTDPFKFPFKDWSTRALGAWLLLQALCGMLLSFSPPETAHTPMGDILMLLWGLTFGMTIGHLRQRTYL